MTNEEREELIEKMAQAAAECFHDDWRHAENWFRDIYITRATAALAVAEPVIREECAKIAERVANGNTVFEKSEFLDGIAFGAKVIAKAIR